MAPLRLTRGIERTFPRPFSETFRISKNEDFNGPYLENENEFLKNSFETVFRASKSCDRGQLVSAFQLTFIKNIVEMKERIKKISPSTRTIISLIISRYDSELLNDCCLQDETELLDRYCPMSSTENSSNSQFVVFTNLHLFYLTWLIFCLRKLPSTICTRFSCWTLLPIYLIW